MIYCVFNCCYMLLFDVLVILKTIELAMFSVNVANKQYSDLNGDYEIVVEPNTKINVVPDIPIVIVQPSFQYRLVSDLKSLTVNHVYGTRALFYHRLLFNFKCVISQIQSESSRASAL
jgi:hypothetical protein